MMSNSFPLNRAVPVVEASDYSVLIDLAYEALVKDFGVATELVDMPERALSYLMGSRRVMSCGSDQVDL